MKQILKIKHIIYLLAMLVFTSCSIKNTKQEKAPNIIFILVDDQRDDLLSCAGHPIVKTPTIDKLAEKGIRFTNAFVTTSICAASRASIFTGLYECKHNYTFGKPALKTKYIQSSYPYLLKEAGYTTGAVGKWHFGLAEEKYHPWNRNFDFFYGFLAGGHDYFFADSTYDQSIKDFWPIHRNKEIVQFGSYLSEFPTDVQKYISYREGEYLTDKFNEEAVD